MSPSITEKDMHCMARLLQSTLFMNTLFYGCNYCKFRTDCLGEKALLKDMHIDELRKKLQGCTGIDLGFSFNPCNPEAKFKPYQ